MKKIYYYIFLGVLSYSLFPNSLYCQQNKIPLNWTVRNPFEQNVFIENKGQFTDEEKSAVSEPIQFYSRRGRLHLYFTKHSIIFRHDSTYIKNDEERGIDDHTTKKDEDENIETKHFYSKITWNASNYNSDIKPEFPVSDYFTYNNPEDKTGHSGIKANAYKKLIYHNVYKGIDMEIFYSEKGRLKYKYIVQTGFDSSQIKMKYGNHVTSINIWDTSTSLVDSNRAYDIDCDLLGNVYVYGGNYPFQLQKYSVNGKLLWTYTTGFFGGGGAGQYCGDFVTDARNGTSYICDGLNYNACQIAKINTSGALSELNAPTDSVWEMWRIGLDYCNNELVVGNGTPPYPYQVTTIDSNLNKVKLENILGTPDLYHDVCLFALDQCGNAFLATALQLNGDSLFNNDLMKIPLPALSPTFYKVSDGYHFLEVRSLIPIYGIPWSNGFNGMAVNKSALFMYDGSALKKYNPATGALKDSIQVTNTSFHWGGLDIDCEENVYTGDRDSIIMLDSNLKRIGYVKLPDTIYAIKVGYTDQVYACGNGFVCSFNALVPASKTVATYQASNSCIGCNGTAIANRSCGIPPINYKWSNGETSQTITGLCLGTYTVTTTDASQSCFSFMDTASVYIPGKAGLEITSADTNPTCIGPKGSLIVYPNGGFQPYTYLWSNGKTTQTDTGLIAGPYYCIVTDSSGCKDSIFFTLTNPPPPNIIVVSYYDTICKGCPDSILVTGTAYYSWNPSSGLSCNNCPNPVASISVTTTYTVTGTDSLGCESERVITILVDNPCENFIVPNVFTPNGDGINDFFEIKTTNLDKYSIIIYDRWGKEMFKSNDPLSYWVGTTESGSDAPDGVYYYLIDFNCNGVSYKKDGFVQLIR